MVSFGKVKIEEGGHSVCVNNGLKVEEAFEKQNGSNKISLDSVDAAKRFGRLQRGANALEYALVAVVVIMVIWVGFDAFGGQLNQFLTEVGNDIIGVGRDLQMGPAR